VPIEPVDKVWMNGRLVDWRNATVHVLSHALHYGTGVFEGMRCYETARGPALFRPVEHFERMARSAALLMMPLPYSAAELVDATRALIEANGLRSCYVRPIAYRGYGEMGVNPDACPVEVTVAVWPWGAYLGEEALRNGVRMTIASWRRHDPNIIPPQAKITGGYVNAALAKSEAVRAGYDEAIMLNPQGYVAEATGENLFIVVDGEILTPPLGAGPLPGITRSSVMQIAADLGMTVRERQLTRSDLYSAEEIFCTGTAAEITPVREVDHRAIGEPGPITTTLQQRFFAIVRGEDDKYRDWLEPVHG
jgi:branched-chain amino acid aminotransferase